MAEGKKSFVLYADLLSVVDKMPDDKAGELLKHILRYVNDLNPETDDLLVQVAFEPIKNQLKRDLKKWEDLKVKRSEAGKRSAEVRAKKDQQKGTNSTSVKSVEQSSTNSTVNDNVNVTVNVNDNVNDKDIKDKPFNFSVSLINYGFKRELVKEWLLVRKNKRLTNTQTAFDKFIKQIEKTKLDKNLILEKCIEKSWGGFESSWIENVSKENQIKDKSNNFGLTIAR